MCPIKDLSDSVRLPRLGKIRLGTRDPDRGFPRKSEFFVFPEDHSDYEKLVALFGDKPKELRILIPVEDEEQWASQYYKAYNQTYGLVCKGDGITAMRMVETKTGKLPDKNTNTPVALQEMPCAGRECLEYEAKKCHEVMNLRFILPEVPGLGVWQIDTGSKNSILNINSCAKLIKRAFGRISLIPLKLTFEPIQVNNPENSKKQTVYVLNLRTDVTMAQLADSARERAKTFLIEGPDMEAVFESEVEKDIQELWPEDKEPDKRGEFEKVDRDIVKEATGKAKKPAPQQETPPQPEPEQEPEIPESLADEPIQVTPEMKRKSLVQMDWLQESLKTLQAKGLKGWSDVNVLKLLNSMTGKENKDIAEGVKNLTREKAELLVKKVQETLDLA